MALLFTRIFRAFLLGTTLLSVALGTPRPADEPAPILPTNPALRWGSGTTALAPALLTSITETKVRTAARTAYLQAEGLAYGVQVGAGAQADRDTAAGLFNFLDSRNNYVENLQLQDLTVLPVGLKKSLSDNNGLLEIGILKAIFFTDRAELSVFVRLKIPSPDPNSTIKERELFFGADKVVFSRDGGLLGDFQLVLLGDFVQPLGNMTLRFKGGLNRFVSPDIATQTYATVSCESLAGLGIAAEVIFPRSMLVPINPTDGAVLPTGQVTLEFKVNAPKFPNFLISINPQQPVAFAVANYEKFGFIVGGLSLDLSDLENPPGIPGEYFAQAGNDQPGGDLNKWRGVYIAELNVLLPSEFKERGKTVRTQLTATNMLYDRNGVSGRVGMTGVPLNLTASGWAMSLRDFELAFEKNKLIGGHFGGDLTLPIAPDDVIRYDALIDRQANYELSLANVTALRFKLWRATAELAPNSGVTLAVVDGAFKPQAILHGRMGIFTTIKGDSATKQTARIGFDGVVFEGLKLQTEEPYLSATYFGYEGDSKLAGFPVTVQRIGVQFANDTVALRFGMRINLMKDRFGGETDFTIVGQFNRINDLHTWTFKRIKINNICVKGTIGTFTLDGCVALFENDPTYGEGFGGRIGFAMKDPAPIKGGDVAAMFGAKDAYRYWFVSGGVALTKPIPIAGPLSINALYLSAYHNMTASTVQTPNPVFLSTSVDSPFARTKYDPSETIHLGFKAVVGLTAIRDNVFRGSAALEMAFSRSDGLNSIGLYGEGQLAGSFTAVTGSDKVNNLMGKYQKVATDVTSKYEINKQQIEQKAKANFDKLKESNGEISGRLAIIYDRPNHTLHGDAEVFVNIGKQPLLITGTGPGGRAGWMVMHFYDQTDWYVHAGTPDPAKRIGLQMGFPGLTARTAGYFMAGYGIPDIPAPPVQVTSMFRNWNAHAQKFKRTDAQKDSLKTGKGVAFGANVALRWDIDLWIPYLRIDALAGFDVMMKSPYTQCRPNPHDWYARGQAYAFLQGEAGVKIFGRRPLITVATAALLDAGLPDPAWLQGQLALKLKLGRVFNKTINFDLAMNRDRICR